MRRHSTGPLHDRRAVLKGITFVIAGSATGRLFAATNDIPADEKMPPSGPKTAADYPVSERMQRVSAYIADAWRRPLPAEVVEKTKWHVLDTLAAIISGSQLPAGRAAQTFAQRFASQQRLATVIGSTALSGPIDAAMLNGTMGHADETDDVVAGPWHPGVNVIPAGLAMAELLRVGGQHFLRAVALGYDIGSRVELATGVTLNFRNPTNSMGGVFGATATAACVARLTPEQIRWAMSYAAQQCSGIDSFRRDPDHIEKGFMNGGLGARAGVTSTLLVVSGFTAVNDIFSGPASFFAAYAPTVNTERLIDHLGEDFYIANSNFKRWPVGGPIQEVLDAVEVLLKRSPVDPRNVREILIRHAPNSITDNAGPLPINVQHAVALMLVDGKLTFKTIHDRARLHDPQIVRLRSLSKVAGAVQSNGPTPAGEGAASAEREIVPMIQIMLADGTRLTQDRVALFRGTPANPYTRDWVSEKAQSLIAPVIGDRRAARLIGHVLNLEVSHDMRELRPFLQWAQSGPPRLSNWPSRS